MLNTVLGGRRPVAARIATIPYSMTSPEGEEFSKTGPETMLESQAEMCAVRKKQNDVLQKSIMKQSHLRES